MTHPTDKANTEPTWNGHRRHAFVADDVLRIESAACATCGYEADHVVHHSKPTPDEIEDAMAATATRAGRIAVVEQLHREGKITTAQARTLLDPPPLAPDEIATVEQAATDAEQRYQARERAVREHARVQAAEVAAHNEAVWAPENKPTRLERKIEAFAQEIHAAGGTPSSAPIRQPLTIAGTFRVYFNRHQAAPLVWCVATDRIELAVAEVIITSAYGARTVYRPKETPDHEDGKPSAWLEVDGVLRIDPSSSTARIG